MPREFYQRRLPHWAPAGAALLLTMRLHGSLPAPLVAQLQADFEAARAHAPDAEALWEVKRAYFGRFDHYLDAGLPESPVWLRHPVVSRLVLESLRWAETAGRWHLCCACIMPNHLHAVVLLPAAPENALETVLHNFKRHTARRANQVLGRTGAFWQSETHDHVIRDAWEGGLSRAVRYVRNNPVKAGLWADWRTWPGTYCPPPWDSEV